MIGCRMATCLSTRWHRAGSASSPGKGNCLDPPLPFSRLMVTPVGSSRPPLEARLRLPHKTRVAPAGLAFPAVPICEMSPSVAGTASNRVMEESAAIHTFGIGFRLHIEAGVLAKVRKLDVVV